MQKLTVDELYDLWEELDIIKCGDPGYTVYGEKVLALEDKSLGGFIALSNCDRNAELLAGGMTFRYLEMIVDAYDEDMKPLTEASHRLGDYIELAQ